MSLFETLSDMSKQHANAGDAGQYKYTALFKDYSEPAPTVSLEIWEYAYNGYYFDVLQKDKIGTSISIFHNDGKQDDPRPFSKEEAERLAKIIVDALNRAEKTAKEITNQTK